MFRVGNSAIKLGGTLASPCSGVGAGEDAGCVEAVGESALLVGLVDGVDLGAVAEGLCDEAALGELFAFSSAPLHPSKGREDASPIATLAPIFFVKPFLGFTLAIFRWHLMVSKLT